MKLISYRHAGRTSYGAVLDGGIADIGARLGGKYAGLREVLAAGALDEVRKEANAAAADLALDDVEVLFPIDPPAEIFCAGRNYREYHEVVQDGTVPEYPSIFRRMARSFAPHNQAILKPVEGERLDYEGELVAVIGKRGRHIAREAALSHVAGYTLMNEGTLRDWSNRGTQNTPSKNFYRSGGLGPWLVTADVIPDPQALEITTRRNGEVVQRSGTDMMLADTSFLISHISKFTWLEPGDMIATGSPGGTIASLGNGDWLKPGDVVEVEIPEIGTLRNPVEAE